MAPHRLHILVFFYFQLSSHLGAYYMYHPIPNIRAGTLDSGTLYPIYDQPTLRHKVDLRIKSL